MKSFIDLDIIITKNDLSVQDKIVEMGVNFVYFSKEYLHYYAFLFQSPYVIPIKIENNEIGLTHSQSGFELFKKEVGEYLEHYQIEGAISQHVLHLWAYISGLAIIVSEEHTQFTSRAMIQEQVEDMLQIYTKDNAK